MADLRSELFEYAERLYEKAVQFLDNQKFRMADIYAICAYSVAVYIGSDKATPDDLRYKAGELEQTTWVLSKEAHGAERGKLFEPSLQGEDPDDQELEKARLGIKAIADFVLQRHRS